MPEPIQLIVGLGNPGDQYAGTRHNAGYWFVDELVRRYGGSYRAERKFVGHAARVVIDGRDVHLLRPTTFMNRSGESVGPLARFFKIPVEGILVAHDELDLPPGTARLKRGGGHGGHNGLRDIARVMGSREYLRLRVGIGHPGHASQVTPWVLGRPAGADREAIERAVEEAADVIPDVIAGDLEKAMNRLHTR